MQRGIRVKYIPLTMSNTMKQVCLAETLLILLKGFTCNHNNSSPVLSQHISSGDMLETAVEPLGSPLVEVLL